MNKDEAQDLWQKVKENSQKLKECTRHCFGDVVGDISKQSPLFGIKRVCKTCGGEMEDRNVILYIRGYKAAGGNPDDVARYCDGESIK